MTYYSRPVEMPKTREEGLRNFVQMIINRIEAGENESALMLAVDLHDELCSKSNPYKEVLAPSKDMVPIAEVGLASREAFKKGYDKGYKAGYATYQKSIKDLLKDAV